MNQAAVDHALAEYPRESCGLLVIIEGQETYLPCRNLAQGSDHFILDPMDYLRADDRGEIVGIVHSHPDAPALPSEDDIIAQQASGLPWHIVSVPKVNWHQFGSSSE